MDKKKIKLAIDDWGCSGYFGYGQGRAVAEFGEEEVGDKSVCHQICPRMEKCRAKHSKMMDEKYPLLAEIVKKTVATAAGTGLPVTNLVVSAMNVAVNRDNHEALKVQEGLKRFKVHSMVDHYIYGQFENLDNGLNKRPPDTVSITIFAGGSKLI